MKFGDIKKNLSLKKKDSAAVPDDVLIESTSAEQIAEMKKRLANRTRDLEEAQSRLQGLNKPDDDDDEDEDFVGPHPPLQELSLDDIKLDDDDDEMRFDTPTDGGSPVQMVDMTRPDAAAEPVSEGLNLEDVPAETDTDADTETEAETESSADDEVSLEPRGEGDDLKNLFSDDEEEEHPLANLINFLPDVSVQELVDDIEEIKSIIKEWQQSR
jgi:hypothetical protein